GGGGPEVVVGVPGSGDLACARSVDVGSVRLTERHVGHDPPTEEERRAIAHEAEATFAALPPLPAGSAAAPIGIAGTMTTLAAVSLGMERYDAARIHGLTLEVSELERVVEALASRPLEARRAMAGLEPKRADVIVAGGTIALALLKRLSA